jgi:histidinol-phosphatase
MPPDARALNPDVASRLDAALEAVRLASAETLRRFNDPTLAIREKADRSPVTEADIAAEKILRDTLLGAFPHDAFLGEESGTAAGTSGYEWIVDPIDGTKSFIRGVPLWATLVGCRHAGRGVVGVIAIPALGEIVYAAAGSGAWHVRGTEPARPARVSTRATLGEALCCTSDFTSFAKRTDAVAGAAARARLETAGGILRTWGDGYGYLLVATGRADVMIDPLMNAWDAAAVETVIAEAGGRFTDWQGHPRIDSGDGLATNGLIHGAMLATIRG